ncbi:MAG: hypothetical protein QGF67_20205 [Lentisphaeria bacterium]|jgi:hypothetical protein|nr:hypothetical protein [Lentisphaeria bacterium]
MKKFHQTKVPVIVILLLALQCGAGTISLEQGVSTDDTTGALDVTITNRGDDVCRNITVTCEFQGIRVTANGPRNLNPDDSGQYTTQLDLGTMPGDYFAIVRTSYSDANMRQFSTVMLHKFAVGSAGVSQIVAKFGDVEIAGHGTAVLSLHSNEGTEVEATLHIYAPNELIVGDLQKTITLAPGAAPTIEIPLENFSALPGSKYPLHVAVTYERAGVRYITPVTAYAQVLETPADSGDTTTSVGMGARPIRIAILVVVAAIVVFYVNRRRRTRQ